MKKFLASVLVLALLFSLVGCSDIGQQFENVGNSFKESMKQAGESLVEGAKEAAKDAVDDAVDSAKDKFNDTVDKGKDKFNDTVDNGKDKLEDAFNRDDQKDSPALPQTGPQENTDSTDNTTPPLPQTGPEENTTPPLPQTGPEENTNPTQSNTPQLPQTGSNGTTELTIRYNANGGCNAPGDQTFEYNTKPRLSNQLPQRPGYHFVGWSRIKNSDVNVFTPGKKTHNPLTVDTTFYALWEKHENPLTSTTTLRFKHNYTVKKENKFAVSIRCSCGLEVTDRTISEGEFSYYYQDAMLWKRKTDKEEDFYVLYKAQDIGPVALMFNTDFYKAPDDSDRIDMLFNTADELAGFVSEVNGYVTDVAEFMAENQASDDIAEEFFEEVGDTTEKVDDVTEKVALAVSIYNLSNSVKQMTTSEDEADALIGFVDTVGFMISYTPLDFYYEPMLDVLKEGIKLWKKCRDKEATFHMIMDKNVINDQCKTLDAVFPGYAAAFLFSCKDGCQCGRTNAACPFENGPTVNEVYLRLANRTNYQPPKQIEKELIVWYLAEKSAHDLYRIAGVTVDDYYSMVK